jgi:uncharacterized membrane protein YeaQ/YmgE (transglycosylase-associated protein family)
MGARTERPTVSNLIWIVVIGFIAGIIARFLSRGPNNPTGFVLTTVLGIAGAFMATFIGQTIGALIVLFIWNRLVAHHVIADPGLPNDTAARGERRWL